MTKGKTDAGATSLKTNTPRKLTVSGFTRMDPVGTALIQDSAQSSTRRASEAQGHGSTEASEIKDASMVLPWK